MIISIETLIRNENNYLFPISQNHFLLKSKCYKETDKAFHIIFNLL